MKSIDFTNDPHLPGRLARLLQARRSRSDLPSALSPELTYGRHRGPAPATARAATVIVLLFRRSGTWHIPLTVRPETVAHHAGQICLPGGVVEPGETIEQAARRELEEELGPRQKLEILGNLPKCYVFASNFEVTPYVAVTSNVPHWEPSEAEVERVVEMPLKLLDDDDSIAIKVICRGGFEFRAPCIRIKNDEIWGATAVMLGQLKDLLGKL